MNPGFIACFLSIFISISPGSARSALESQAYPQPPDGYDSRREGIERGKLETFVYDSTTVGIQRKARVYTPPGYSTSQKYPVLYLLHGIGGDENEWPRGGNPDVIMDNLIADKKSVPMVVVMPNGRAAKDIKPNDPIPKQSPAFAAFEKDLLTDLIPAIEKAYSVKTDRESRALAGLSMGGAQTLNLFAEKPADYAYVGVFSSGIFARDEEWEKANKSKLTAAEAKDGLKLLWFATGKDDFLLNRTKSTLELLKKLELKPEYKETEGGHTWINWQLYLNEFAPKLFDNK